MRISAMAYTVSLLLSLQAEAEPLEAKKPWLGSDELNVESYSLWLRIPEMSKDTKVEIRASIQLKLLKAGNHVKLHFEPSAISSLQVKQGGKNLTFRVLDGVPSTPKSHLSGAVLDIETSTDHSAGETFRLELSYTVTPDTSESQLGMSYQKNFGNNGPLLNTRNWPYYARYWLPSNDHPSNPAIFRFELHVPDGYIAAANGVLEEGSYEKGSGLDSEGLRVFKWKQDEPLTTYGVNISVAKFQVEKRIFCFSTEKANASPSTCRNPQSKNRTTGIFYHVNGKREFEETLKLGEKALAFFSSTIGAFPWAKLGFVQAPSPFNMESASLITLVDSDSTVHEVAHQWWGDSVRIGSWGDLWISEGFTTYFDGLFHEFTEGKNTACKGTKNPAFPEDTDPLKIFNNTPYCSGSSALADLRARLSNVTQVNPNSAESRELFLALAREHYRLAQGQAVTTKEFLAFVRNSSRTILKNAGWKFSDIELKNALSEWELAWFSSSE